MKKLLIFVCLLFLQFAFGVKSLAYDFQIGDLCYTITSTTDKTVSVEAASQEIKGDVVIPSIVSYNDVDFIVTSIPDYGFAYCHEISSLTIPTTMTYIGDSAFSWMWYLEVLIFDNPQQLNVNPWAFNYDWRAFKSVKIINSDEKEKLNYGVPLMYLLPSHELYLNGNIVEDYKVPEGVENIGVLFTNCNTLKTIDMPNSIKQIEPLAFYNCTALKTITLSSSLNQIGYEAFSGCPELNTIYVKSTTPPTIVEGSFSKGAYMYANVYIPKGTLSDYQNADNWKNFANLIEKEYDDVSVPTKQKCATPTITYENGKIVFNSETEGTEFASEIKCSDIGVYSSQNINISATYSISVYAKKDGYDNSETVTATLCWIEQEPKTEGISNGIAAARANAVLIQSNGGQLTVGGLNDNETVEVYSMNGTMRGAGISRNGVAQINTDLKSGDIGIVKIKNKSVKVIVK